MSSGKNYRAYFVVCLLAVFGTIILLREHRPSFLRPSLHMYAYVALADGTVAILDLAKLQAIGRISVGPTISDLREQTNREEIWGVSTSGGYVFVVDTPTNRVTQIPVGPTPYSLDFSSSGNRIYTTTAGSDQLVAVDAGSRQVYGRAHTNAEPVQARLTPDEKNIVVVNRRAGMVSIHDARTLQLLSSVAVIAAPEEVVVAPDSKLAFVMSRTQNRLSVVDLERAVLVTNLELAGKPTQILLKPDGGELYVISPEAHGLQAINTWTHEVGDTMVLGFAPSYAVISADSSEMYVTDYAAARVIPLDINNRRLLERPIPVGGTAGPMRFSPADWGAEAAMLLVADQSSDDVAVIRTRTDSLITLIPVGAQPERIAVKMF